MAEELKRLEADVRRVCSVCTVHCRLSRLETTIEVRLVRSTETESKAVNQSTKGTFLHEANPLFTPIGLCLANAKRSGWVAQRPWIATARQPRKP